METEDEMFARLKKEAAELDAKEEANRKRAIAELSKDPKWKAAYDAAKGKGDGGKA